LDLDSNIEGSCSTEQEPIIIYAIEVFVNRTWQVDSRFQNVPDSFEAIKILVKLREEYQNLYEFRVSKTEIRIKKTVLDLLQHDPITS
jgi:hypothetical protein